MYIDAVNRGALVYDMAYDVFVDISIIDVVARNHMGKGDLFFKGDIGESGCIMSSTYTNENRDVF